MTVSLTRERNCITVVAQLMSVVDLSRESFSTGVDSHKEHLQDDDGSIVGVSGKNRIL